MARPKLKQDAHNVCDAWEKLRGNEEYTSAEIEAWLVTHMKPAMDNLRKTLGREIPTG